MNTIKLPAAARGMLFDLDGVIVDSEGEYTTFWGPMGARYGHPEGYAYAIKGTNLQSILEGYPEADRPAVVAELHKFEAEMKYPYLPGAAELLKKLREEGKKIALVTSSDRTKMEFLFGRHPELREAFDVIITGDMVSHGKPDPEGYLKAAELLGLRAEECVVFEDSLQGLGAGRAAGAYVVGVATTNPASMLEGKADVIVDGLFEVEG